MSNITFNSDEFSSRHNSISPRDENLMLKQIGVKSVDELIKLTIPDTIRLENDLILEKPKTENEFLSHFKTLALKNRKFKTYIGTGYYDCFTPNVIKRNILENPGWYTAYTPYQAEIAQGRMEALINYQTMVTDLTGMEISNASLLDEGTAASEAMTMFFRVRKGPKKNAFKFFVSNKIFPQTIELLKTRSEPLGIELVIDELDKFNCGDDYFGALFQYPDNDGNIVDLTSYLEKARSKSIFTCVASDLMSLVLLKSPGEMGADAVVGNSQRFGVPMGYGGPHAAFYATKEEFKRHIPGRIIGVSVDSAGNNAYRMALQTREQHIKRDRATSNICTAQVLLSVMAGMYAVYHGKDGLIKIATKIATLTQLLENGISSLDYNQENENFFDTLKIKVSSEDKDKIKKLAEKNHLNFRYFETDHIGISLDETTQVSNVLDILNIFSEVSGKSLEINLNNIDDLNHNISGNQIRNSEFLSHEVFNKYHTEHEILRYMKRLENKDLSLVHSMISLGSCTMKLNATTEMIPVTWEEMNLHPFVPMNQAEGYSEMINSLNTWLCEITGFSAISFQPNSGAQGEYTGLMVIRAYHLDKGNDNRNIALIPSSAHGTNPASAIMAGMKVVVVACDKHGNIDYDDLKEKCEEHSKNLSCLMITYPSTHGVFEDKILEVCNLIHENGGLVYMDGANMNAQVGLTNPKNIGADVCHLNLHKTFCIPHGGGGPGMGPIGVVEKLVKYLPRNIFSDFDKSNITPVSSAPYGSASILAISYSYISMMGGSALKKATELSILNANYIRSRLQDHYQVLYKGINGTSAHEFIIDCRDFKSDTDIEVEDIAKRLMDYGYHAPTVSFPVPGTMMIEPTESETKAELDKFCDVMIEIRNEIEEIRNGTYDKVNNVLKNAPHTASVVTASSWVFPYTREKAAYPLDIVSSNKFWPSVGRVDNAHGDRNLFCSCIPLEEYSS
ncbi:MAG: aminomethyl-transferring glycine dehydrogenase [Cytophagales bacterium]